MPFEYAIRTSPRARRLSVTVYCDGRVAVTLPRRLPRRAAEEFARSRAAWIESKLARFRRIAHLPEAPRSHGPRRDYLARREEARALASELVARWSAFYGFGPRRISIRNTKSRWGSCSASGTISLSYRILALPPELRDYLVVHELCHLRHLHHGSSFWAEVSRALPNYATLRRRLRGLEG